MAAEMIKEELVKLVVTLGVHPERALVAIAIIAIPIVIVLGCGIIFCASLCSDARDPAAIRAEEEAAAAAEEEGEEPELTEAEAEAMAAGKRKVS